MLQEDGAGYDEGGHYGFQFLLGCYFPRDPGEACKVDNLSIPFRMLPKLHEVGIESDVVLSIPFRMLRVWGGQLWKARLVSFNSF